jgi:hypothetical protein
MKTPITDAVNTERYVDHHEGYCAMLNTARRLELDRAALMEALEGVMKHFAPMAGDCSEIEQSTSEIAASSKAEATLAAARANFPTE